MTNPLFQLGFIAEAEVIRAGDTAEDTAEDKDV